MHIRFIFCTLENIYKYLQTHLRLCEICGFYKKRKPSGSRHGDTFEYPTKCSTDEASNSIKNAIKMKGDQRLQALVGDINLHVKEVKYHNNCQKSYIQSVGSCDNVDTYEKQECTSMTSLRDSHQIAFVSLSNYIEDNIIKGMQEESLPSLHKRYMETLDPVIPKIIESAMLDPLILVQAKFNAKQSAADIKHGLPRPTVFSTIFPRYITAI